MRLCNRASVGITSVRHRQVRPFASDNGSASCSSGTATPPQQQQQQLSNHLVSQTQACRCGPPEAMQRRVLTLGALAALGLSAAAQPHRATAAEQERPLPKAYQTVAQKIIRSLREALEAEQDAQAKEYEIRRKADPAKENVREFVGKWRDDARVTWHPSHQEIEAAITELGRFYQSAGPRARLSPEVQRSVLSHLDAAELTLPQSKDTDGGFGGLFS